MLVDTNLLLHNYKLECAICSIYSKMEWKKKNEERVAEDETFWWKCKSRERKFYSLDFFSLQLCALTESKEKNSISYMPFLLYIRKLEFLIKKFKILFICMNFISFRYQVLKFVNQSCARLMRIVLYRVKNRFNEIGKSLS